MENTLLQTSQVKAMHLQTPQSHVVTFQNARPLSATFKLACNSCSVRHLCMPISMGFEDMERINNLVLARKRVKKGATIYRNGEEFTALYAIRTGFFKTTVAAEDGRDQVTGFQMAAEILGMDGIGTNRHSCDAIALEDADVCVIPFNRIEEITRDVEGFGRHIHRLMSREIVREHSVMLLLGSMRADERLAAFLLDLVQRLHARGYSSSELVLRMTREEMGSYLGLKLETVSRMFSKFMDEGLIEVKQRHVRILDPQALAHLVSRHHAH